MFKESDGTFVTAVIERGVQGMKLSSALQLCGCESPKIPSVGLPPIFDIGLVGGSISFTYCSKCAVSV